MNIDENLIVNNDARIDGKLTVGKDITATGQIEARKIVGDGAVISRMIVMWSGTVHDIPDGWLLCNGDKGTPDLRSRFIVGAVSDSDSEYKPGEKGEADTHTHSIKEQKITSSTAEAGDHTHNPPQEWYTNIHPNHNAADKAPSYSFVDSGGKDVKSQTTTQNGKHKHDLSFDIDSSTSGSSSGPNRPKWYALCFIMKL